MQVAIRRSVTHELDINVHRLVRPALRGERVAQDEPAPEIVRIGSGLSLQCFNVRPKRAKIPEPVHNRVPGRISHLLPIGEPQLGRAVILAFAAVNLRHVPENTLVHVPIRLPQHLGRFQRLENPFIETEQPLGVPETLAETDHFEEDIHGLGLVACLATAKFICAFSAHHTEHRLVHCKSPLVLSVCRQGPRQPQPQGQVLRRQS